MTARQHHYVPQCYLKGLVCDRDQVKAVCCRSEGAAYLQGREEELELLLRRLSKAKTGQGQVVLLSGITKAIDISLAGTVGSVRIRSGVISAVFRGGCTLSIAIMGVGCAHEYEIS
jgi:hypothetical protein